MKKINTNPNHNSYYKNQKKKCGIFIDFRGKNKLTKQTRTANFKTFSSENFYVMFLMEEDFKHPYR